MYIQRGRAPGRIGRVRMSKTGRTIFYGDMELASLGGRGYKANYIDSATNEEYWVSAPRKDGQDTLYPGRIEIDDDVREEYWHSIRSLPDSAAFASFRSLGVHGKHASGEAMDGFRVFFELRPLSDVQPWGNAETGLKLHWFGLTDGWYDVAIDGQRLYSGPGETRGIDYQVVRLWEDLIEVAPFALESVPEPLASRLADFDAWTAWVGKTWDLDDRDEVVSTALDWWFHREMSASHLVGAPSLQMWRCGDELHLHWKSVPGESGPPVWASPNGQARTNADAFYEELIKFDRELITAMGTRVSEIEKNWSRPEIAINVEDLRCEHADRASWLQRAFRGPRYRQRSWDEVVDAVIALENRVGRP